MDQRLTTLAALEAIRNQQHHLEETIGRILALMKTLPEGEARDGLLEEISCLDVIAEVIRPKFHGCREGILLIPQDKTQISFSGYWQQAQQLSL